ncbi:MAG TPA: hypothetical protein VJQ79_12490 [Acidimicrobiia bacterium]|nr:hypothetical protein [Acidimicrobiia bacterium]
MKKPVLATLWIVATLATTAIAYVAVNAAGAEVTDRPLTSVVATGDSAASSSTSTTGQPGTSTSTTGGSSTTPATGTTGGTGTTGTTGGSTTPTSGSSTSSTATTGTTLSDAPWQQTTIPSKGGLVIVSYRPGEVKLESVAPTPGFSYEIDDQGPPEVRVEFEGGEVRVEVRVRWDGGLVTEIDESN